MKLAVLHLLYMGTCKNGRVSALVKMLLFEITCGKRILEVIKEDMKDLEPVKYCWEQNNSKSIIIYVLMKNVVKKFCYT